MKKQNYKQLDQKERERIFSLKQNGKTNMEIALDIGRDKSTIGRELRRNRYYKLGRYLPDTAQKKADKRKAMGRKQLYIEKDPLLKKRIISKLKKGWSPDIIAGRMKLDNKPYLNQESIYQFIYGSEGKKLNLKQYLRLSHRVRMPKQGRTPHDRIGIPDRVDIAQRPKYIEKRIQFGHWEGDNVVYNRHRNAVATSVERKTRKTIIFKPKNLTAKEKAKRTIQRYRYLPKEACRTMTFDNGKEATAHMMITKAVGMKCYFAKPYASYQRGTNENKNGLVRFYLPRETNLDLVSAIRIRRVENQINNRPMKLLSYQTPNEAFAHEIAKLQSGRERNSETRGEKIFIHKVALAN